MVEWEKIEGEEKNSSFFSPLSSRQPLTGGAESTWQGGSNEARLGNLLFSSLFTTAAPLALQTRRFSPPSIWGCHPEPQGVNERGAKALSI